ncbi:MAG: hypothetical protein ABIN79_00775 [Marmoricola sp.]
MRHQPTGRHLHTWGALAASLVLLTSACGSDGATAAQPRPDESPSAASADTSLGEGAWLLGITSAGGADGETTITSYVTLNPSTGEASTRQIPGVNAASSTPREAALLVSSDRAWAISDTSIPTTQTKSGQLTVYSLADDTTETIDMAARTGESGVEPIAWAFDPESTDTLRVVDATNRVWAVAVSGGKATAEAPLPGGAWVFTDGFDPNTGEPWVESIDSDATMPAGQGPSDTRPVTRLGGTVLPAESPALSSLPPGPCRLGAGFTDSSGLTWTFCADQASVSTHYLPDGAATWVDYGKPSSPVAPIASGFALVLPPAE